MIEDKINHDLKQALLSRNQELVDVLRYLKSIILSFKIDAAKDRQITLPDDEVIKILSKEVKKLTDSADLFLKGGSKERADHAINEKNILEKYLPIQLSEEQLSLVVDKIIKNNKTANMGQIITEVKASTVGQAEGSLIAKIVKKKLLEINE